MYDSQFVCDKLGPPTVFQETCDSTINIQYANFLENVVLRKMHNCVYVIQDRRKVWKSRGASSKWVGIIFPPGCAMAAPPALQGTTPL